MVVIFLLLFFASFSDAKIDLSKIRCYHVGDEIEFTNRNARFLRSIITNESSAQKEPRRVSLGMNSDAKDIEVRVFKLNLFKL